MKNLEEISSTKEIGFVVSSQDYLVNLTGLPTARINDLVADNSGNRALITALGADLVQALMFDPKKPKPGELFELKKSGLRLPPAEALLNRTIDPLGRPLDGKGEIPPGNRQLEFNVPAMGIASRALINQQLNTGITLVDTLLPIAKGQRQLIFGDPRSGKTSFLLNLIINQKNQNIICIYTSIGKSEIDTKRFIQLLEAGGGKDYTIVISASSSLPTPLITIAPTVAFHLAEELRQQGKDVLLILDDMGLHAKYLREITLLSKQTPGRESYPGDIFYQHAHLFEKAGNFNQSVGGGSITLLPVIETELENFTTLIPTNLMATTDGHLLFSANLRAQGRYPAINIEQSVTRVGRNSQHMLQKSLAEKLLSLFADYRAFEQYGHFGGELTSRTRFILKQGMIAQELLNQEPDEMISPTTQIAFMALIFTPFFIDRDINFVINNKKAIIQALTTQENFAKFRDLDNFPTFEIYVDELRKQLPVLEKVCQK